MMKKLLAAALALCLLTGGTALAACDVCGGDQQCDECLGMGFVMAKMYGSDELVQIGCTGANCDDGVCTACAQAEQTAAPTPEPSPEPTPTPEPLAGSHVFADRTVEKAALKTLKKSEQDVVMEEELSQISWLFIPLEKDSIVLDDLAFMPNLKTLSLKSMNLYAREVDLAPIQACTKLEELKVYVETNDTVKNLRAAAALPLLRELGVGGGKLSGEEAAWIGQMPQLEKLTLRRLPITDISWISGNTALEELEITKTGITSADALRNLQQLTMVTIDENAETPDMSFLLGRGIRTKVRMLERPFDQWYETWGPKEPETDDAQDPQSYHQNRGGGTY